MMIKVALSILALTSSLWAAVPATSKSSWDKELEVLSLPLSNQKRLLKSDTGTLDRLVSIAQDTTLSLDLRWKSIMALGFLESRSVMPNYLVLAQSKEWFVKNGLLIAMDENAHPQRFVIAKKFVKDPSLIVRSSAFDILMQESGHRDILWEELFSTQNVKKNRSLWVRPKIIKYMNQNPKLHERAFFEKLSQEKEPEIVGLANKGLQKINALSTQNPTQSSKTF
ncbi:MAG: hypothetical protein JNL11_04295 [Bdellovibrionaceae bacterium]|nr:hypothetical protein [Pseudobdellovibrionaceae bacterium]